MIKQFYSLQLDLAKSTKLNGSKFWYVSQTIQLKIFHLFTHS